MTRSNATLTRRPPAAVRGRPARREADRKSRIGSPRDGSGTSPACSIRSARPSAPASRRRDRRSRSTRPGAFSHAPRHSSSCSVMTPSSDSSCAVRDAGRLVRRLVDLLDPRSAARQVGAHRHHVRVRWACSRQHRVEARDGLDLGRGQPEQRRRPPADPRRVTRPRSTAPGRAAA